MASLRITAAASMPYASSFFSGATANIGSEFFAVQNWETASKGQMQRKLIQLGATVILTLCICGHVSEIFHYCMRAPCQILGAKAGRQSTHARGDGWSTADSNFVRGRSRFMTCSSDVILARLAIALGRCVGHQGTQIGELSKASNASDSFSSMKPG